MNDHPVVHFEIGCHTGEKTRALEIYLNKAGKLGGKTPVPPVTLPGQGSFAWLAAPESNIIGIWKPEYPLN